MKDRGQGHGSRSKVKVDIRGSVLPSAAKSNKSHYQSKLFVCMSVIRGHIRRIARMRLSAFQSLILLILLYKLTEKSSKIMKIHHFDFQIIYVAILNLYVYYFSGKITSRIYS